MSQEHATTHRTEAIHAHDDDREAHDDHAAAAGAAHMSGRSPAVSGEALEPAGGADVSAWPRVIPKAPKGTAAKVTPASGGSGPTFSLELAHELPPRTPEVQAMLDRIAANRASIHGRKLQLTKMKASKGKVGYDYSARKDATAEGKEYAAWNKAAKPTVEHDDALTRAQREIWDDIAFEGDSSAMNTYDDKHVTWGRGFAAGGQLEGVMGFLFDESPAAKEAFFEAGITLRGRQFVAVDTENGIQLEGTPAQQLIQVNEQLISLFVDVGQSQEEDGGQEVRQHVLNAQYKQFLEHTGDLSPAAVAWPRESRAVAAHAIHNFPGRYHWADFPSGELASVVGHIIAKIPGSGKERHASGAVIVNEGFTRKVLHYGGGKALAVMSSEVTVGDGAFLPHVTYMHVKDDQYRIFAGSPAHAEAPAAAETKKAKPKAKAKPHAPERVPERHHHHEMEQTDDEPETWAELFERFTAAATPEHAPAEAAHAVATAHAEKKAAVAEHGEDEDEDEYLSQGDNTYIDDTFHGKGGSAGTSCNMTALTMSLVSLADGDEERVRHALLAALRKRKYRKGARLTIGGKSVALAKLVADPAIAAHAELADLMVAYGVSRDNWGSLTKRGNFPIIAKELGLATGKTVSGNLSNAAVRKRTKEALDGGARIVAHTDNHFVYLVDVLPDEGAIVHDPAGMRLAAKGAHFLSHNHTKWLKRLRGHEKLALERAEKNPALLATITKLVDRATGRDEEGDDAPATGERIEMGERNFYSIKNCAEFGLTLATELHEDKEE